MFKVKTYDELTFADDYLFCRIMRDETICKGVIKALLNVEVDHVEYLNNQQEFSPDYDAKGIRMDVYVKDSDRIFDLEMQTSHFEDVAMRARYYQGLVDLDTLGKARNYKDLKESFIVFICTRDPFGCGLPCYTVEQVCKEDFRANSKINDKSHKLYYNAESWHKSENTEVRALLKFLTTQAAETDLTQTIQSAVCTSKKNEPWRKNFMTLYEMIDDATINGIAIGREEGILIGEERGREEGEFRKACETARNLFLKGMDIVFIQDVTGLSYEQLEKIADELDADN